MTFSFCKGLVIMNHFQFIKSIPINIENENDSYINRWLSMAVSGDDKNRGTHRVRDRTGWVPYILGCR
ncbi:hypothetical protein PGJ_00013780 [Porphyromonas gingivalis AJW4]|nr:hypothetical protein PGJ_00013780 [Porphyromonas gingivalis AJW4]